MELQQTAFVASLLGSAAGDCGAFLFGSLAGPGTRLLRTPLLAFGLTLFASPLLPLTRMLALQALGCAVSGSAQEAGSTLAFYLSVLLFLGGVPPAITGFLLSRKRPPAKTE
jgi:hypothetical protein